MMTGLILSAIFSSLATADETLPARLPVTAKPAVNLPVEYFDLADVRLGESPFKEAMDTDQAYLLRLDPDRFLAWFRKVAGLAPKGEVYGGWESQGVAGHSLGHYLSACAHMYRATGNPKLLERPITPLFAVPVQAHSQG